MKFEELRGVYNPERDALCVDSEGNIVAGHAIGFLCTRPITDYGARKVESHTDRHCDILVRFAEEGADNE